MPALRWLAQTSPLAGALNVSQTGSAAGILLLTGTLDGQAMADRLAQDGTLILASNASTQTEAHDAVNQLLTYPQLNTSTIGVIGVGAGTAQALQLAHSHRAVGAVALIGDLPDNANWQTDFALLQERGAKTLILPGHFTKSWEHALRFLKQYAV
ncbi:MAG: hypothetical protein ACYDBJ_19450 [Aggregatilineales bacterium]